MLVVVTAAALITLDVRESGPLSSVRAGARDALTPVTDAVDAAVSPVGAWLDGVTRAAALKDENARLERELDQARGQSARERLAIEENKELRQLLDLPYYDDAHAVAAQVVEDAPGNFELTVQIDKGTNDGVGPDMAVVTGAGLVGRVLDGVSRNRATVLLVEAPQSGVGVKLEQSQKMGVLRGRADRGALRLEFVDPDVSVTKGELVFTAGQQASPFPPGIPVGRVSRVTSTPGDLQQDILVEPLAELGSLEYVKVLPPEPGT